MSFTIRTLDNPSQLVLRHKDKLANKSILLAGMSHPDWPLMWSDMCPNSAAPDVFTTDYDVFSALEAHQEESASPQGKRYYGSQFTGEKRYDLIILYARKSTLETQFLIHMLLPSLQSLGRLWLVGEKKGGVQSQSRALHMAYTQVTKLDAARHCLLYEATLKEEPQPFIMEDWVYTDTLDIHNQPVTLCSLPGVFSYRRLDQGSAFLLKTLANTPISGRVLDFGCGVGVIGAWLALRAKAQLQWVMLDNSALAIESSRRTLAANGLSADFLSSNGWQNVEGNFDVIVSNPPFHKGIATCYAPTERLIQHSQDFLRPKGVLYLVANTFLPYPALMQSAFGSYEAMAKSRAFTVYQGQKKTLKRGGA